MHDGASPSWTQSRGLNFPSGPACSCPPLPRAGAEEGCERAAQAQAGSHQAWCPRCQRQPAMPTGLLLCSAITLASSWDWGPADFTSWRFCSRICREIEKLRGTALTRKARRVEADASSGQKEAAARPPGREGHSRQGDGARGRMGLPDAAGETASKPSTSLSGPCLAAFRGKDRGRVPPP